MAAEVTVAEATREVAIEAVSAERILASDSRLLVAFQFMVLTMRKQM
jgi:hypothetical protein